MAKEFRDYVSKEKVRARRVSDEGETVLTTTHGIELVFGGYVVLREDGSQDYMESGSFESKFELVRPKPVKKAASYGKSEVRDD